MVYTLIMNSCLQLYSMIHRPHLKLGAEASDTEKHIDWSVSVLCSEVVLGITCIYISGRSRGRCPPRSSGCPPRCSPPAPWASWACSRASLSQRGACPQTNRRPATENNNQPRYLLNQPLISVIARSCMSLQNVGSILAMAMAPWYFADTPGLESCIILGIDRTQNTPQIFQDSLLHQMLMRQGSAWQQLFQKICIATLIADIIAH